MRTFWRITVLLIFIFAHLVAWPALIWSMLGASSEVVRYGAMVLVLLWVGKVLDRWLKNTLKELGVEL